jgi:hypothetical protein
LFCSVGKAGALAFWHLQGAGAYGVGFDLAFLAREGVGLDLAGHRNQISFLDRRRELLQAAVTATLCQVVYSLRASPLPRTSLVATENVVTVERSCCLRSMTSAFPPTKPMIVRVFILI